MRRRETTTRTIRCAANTSQMVSSPKRPPSSPDWGARTPDKGARTSPFCRRLHRASTAPPRIDVRVKSINLKSDGVFSAPASMGF
jgi:hypothetical protein